MVEAHALNRSVQEAEENGALDLGASLIYTVSFKTVRAHGKTLSWGWRWQYGVVKMHCLKTKENEDKAKNRKKLTKKEKKTKQKDALFGFLVFVV